jgi:SagB-type dehydrogenase family enzyme
MNLEAFLHNLHFNIEKASPPNWEVDWDDAPLTYKLYRGLPVIPLSLEVPLTLNGTEATVKPDLSRIGHFLWYVFGLTQFSESVMNLDFSDQAIDLMQSKRRFVPSGGALYPSELYVYLKIKNLPAGVYHYDVAHHCLVLLREGNFDSYISRALGNRCSLSDCFGTVFVSTMFWKNFFKYNNFAYRLQGLDAGVLIGQLLEVAKSFGFATGVYFQFLDRAINHLLGLSEQEESVYAVIPLSESTSCFNSSNIDGDDTATELCKELAAIQSTHYVQSRRVLEFPMLTKMNEGSMLESTRLFREINEELINCEDQTVNLPDVMPLSYDLASVCRKRFSPDIDFVSGNINQLQLATLFKSAMDSFSYQNDLDGVQKNKKSRVSLYGCLYNVESIPNGAYYYDSLAHTLRRIQLGDQRLRLQYGMSGGNVNMFQVPLCLHVAGDKNHYKKEMGYRGYRIQQMEAGMLVQRILLVASALRFGGHPILGFDASNCDDIYKMRPSGKTTLIQIPTGPYRQRPWLSGSLHS